MKISLKRINDNFLFELCNEKGNTIRLDNTGEGNEQAVCPMEALLMSLVSCGSMDVVAILKKQQQIIQSFKAEVEGERIPLKTAHPFSKIKIQFLLEGIIDPQKAKRAVELSFQKYCSVALSLNPQIEITWETNINGQIV